MEESQSVFNKTYVFAAFLKYSLLTGINFAWYLANRITWKSLLRYRRKSSPNHSFKRNLDQGAKSERIYRLKRTRTGKKANVSKLRNEVQQRMADYKSIVKVSEKFVKLDIAMKTFREAHLKYHAELTDELDIDESKGYNDSEEAKFSRLLDNISTSINTEKRRIEETIAEFTSDVEISPQDSVSDIGRRNVLSYKNYSIQYYYSILLQGVFQ